MTNLAAIIFIKIAQKSKNIRQWLNIDREITLSEPRSSLLKNLAN
jgi:hypothetical protein